MKIFFLLFSALLLTSAWTKTAEEWRSRVIYQIITDRFGRTDDETPQCKDLFDYCGGTFKGIEKNLDYIKEMGADAIWISPVLQNAPKGYHGYWTTNLYELNPHFGSKQDFKDLIDACHEKDIWVMVDVVPNHVAPVPNENLTNYDFSGIYPFNDAKYYHWPSTPVCQWIDDNDPYNQSALETCWLLDLPDLKHEDPYVTETLIEWVNDFVQTYNVDGLRLDAVRHIPKWFWKRFTETAGVYTVGEVFNHDIHYCAGYQEVMSSLLNFPLHGTLDQIFRQNMTMTLLTRHYEFGINEWKDLSVLGNFASNHDFPRFLNMTPDVEIYKAYYTYILTSVGIPMIYYGDEQSFTGGPDPGNREPLWGKMNPEADMYQYFKTILTFKKQSQYHNFEQVERLVEDDFYSFTRGDSFFAFTNSNEKQVKTIRSHPYAEGTYLCSIFNKKECVQVQNGEFEIVMLNKIPLILAPQPGTEPSPAAKSAWKNLKEIWTSIFVQDPTKANSLFYSEMKR